MDSALFQVPESFDLVLSWFSFSYLCGETQKTSFKMNSSLYTVMFVVLCINTSSF